MSGPTRRSNMLMSIAGVMLAACATPKQQETVQVPHCDTIPRVEAGSRPPRLPPPPEVNSAFGAIVGTVEELGTGAAIRVGGRVRLMSNQERFIGTDSTGGFAFDRVAPGRYLVSFAHIGYDVRSDSVIVAAGTVDTLHLRLQYRVCP
jgi:hypothetical protein